MTQIRNQIKNLNNGFSAEISGTAHKRGIRFVYIFLNVCLYVVFSIVVVVSVTATAAVVFAPFVLCKCL